MSGPAAGGPIPEHTCQKPVRVGGILYGVQGSGVRCNFMRFWTHRWLTRGGEPRHWSCVDLGDDGDCHRRGGGAKFEYYAYD